MHAVAALCHFCENHGPRVVMTCQPLRDFDAVDDILSCPSSSMSPSTSSAPQGPVIPLEIDEEMLRGDRSMLLNSTNHLGFPHYGNCVRNTEDSEDRCNACSSFGDGPCLLSNDHPNKTSYISSEVALQERVYERVRNACLRSLSCEISTGPRKSSSLPTSPSQRHQTTLNEATASSRIAQKSSAITISSPNGQHNQSIDVNELELNGEEADGCVTFGDADNGFCFSYTFRLADAKARGFMRLFSLIVVSNDLTFLTNNYYYFKNSLGAIKTKLQSLAASTYEREIQEIDQNGDDGIMRPEYASMVGRMPRWFKRKIAIDTDRNLSTITSCRDIWSILHRQLMWALRSPTLTCRDQVMEGKPTQDMMVLMELDESAIVELELHHPNQYAVRFFLVLLVRIFFAPRFYDVIIIINIMSPAMDMPYYFQYSYYYSYCCKSPNSNSSTTRHERCSRRRRRSPLAEMGTAAAASRRRRQQAGQQERADVAVGESPIDYDEAAASRPMTASPTIRCRQTGVRIRTNGAEPRVYHDYEKWDFKVSMNQLANLKWIASQLEASNEGSDLDLLIRHIVTGGQIVAIAKERQLSRQFLLAVSNLLPIGCLKLATYKEHYLPEYSTRFNLIGGPLEIDVPLEVSDVMIIRITPRGSMENISLRDCIIDVRRRPEKDERGQRPQIVKRFRDLLLDPIVNDTVLETTLRTTRETWMSKAKICYQMRNQPNQTDAFKLINGVTMDDRQVVLFWQAGLSNAYKNHVLSTIDDDDGNVIDEDDEAEEEDDDDDTSNEENH
ncbi:unnamed protein product [Caenorhabditis bovis]|uniref:Folliculin n=1 Tax=Caenorhabditis bovis TaxID=2654633 RepID=A0A8S1EX53_9PELO|nr:unnamed protein product [Caenorhabditis bovis]